MNNQQTIEKIRQIIDNFFDAEALNKAGLTYNEKLHIILSESQQAMSLITIIEDEFDITFEDDDIDLRLFLDIQVIQQKVLQYLTASIP